MLQGQPLHLLKYALQIITDASRRVSAHLGEHTAGRTWSLTHKVSGTKAVFGPKGVTRLPYYGKS